MYVRNDPVNSCLNLTKAQDHQRFLQRDKPLETNFRGNLVIALRNIITINVSTHDFNSKTLDDQIIHIYHHGI